MTDPATGERLGAVPDMGAAETGRAVEAAHAAFPAWRDRMAKDRAALLRRLAVRSRRDVAAAAADLGLAARITKREHIAAPK